MGRGPTVAAATERDRGRSALVAAGVALAVALLVWGVGVAPIPEYEALAAHPDSSIPGRVAFVRMRDRPCVWVVAAAGGEPRRLMCTAEERGADWLGGPLGWTRDGKVAVQAFGPGGNHVLVLDPESGGVLERIRVDEPMHARRDPAGGSRSDGARILVNRSGRTATLGIAPVAASPLEVARVSGPPGYGFADPRWSPDGEWILVRDTNDKLLVARAAEGAGLRLLADRVWMEYAWHVPGSPADVDLDSLRAARLARPPEGG